MINCTTWIRAGRRRFCVLATVCLTLSACSSGGQDFAFHPISEIPQGRGLITDESGRFTVAKIDLSGKSGAHQGATGSTSAPAKPNTVVSTSGITETVTPE